MEIHTNAKYSFLCQISAILNQEKPKQTNKNGKYLLYDNNHSRDRIKYFLISKPQTIAELELPSETVLQMYIDKKWYVQMIQKAYGGDND